MTPFPRLLLHILCLAIGLITHGQPAFKNLKFHSKAERLAFKSLETDHPDYLGLMIQSYDFVEPEEVIKIQVRMADVYRTLSQAKAQKKAPKKQAKLIHQTVHDQNFRLYEYENVFTNVFDNGRYNCVSATAIYALTFDTLGLPFQVMEQPNHVYLIGWPGTENIVIEGTDPSRGFGMVDDRFKYQYIERMLESKMIDPSLTVNMTHQQIYDMLAKEQNSPINLRQLVGVQYSNYGSYALNEGDYEAAISFLDKAVWLYPEREVITEMQVQARSLFLVNSKAEIDDRYIKELIRFSNTRQDDQEKQMEFLMNIYLKVLNDHLVSSIIWDNVERWNRQLIRGLKDSAHVHAVAEVFYYEHGRLSMQQGDFENALPYLDTALIYKPNNQDLQALVSNAIASSCNLSTTEDCLVLMDQFETRHPHLKTVGMIQSLRAQAHVIAAYEALTDDNLGRAMLHIRKFEEIMPNASVTLVGAQSISAMYGEAVGLYFELGNKKVALDLANRGLEYVPTSVELNAKKRLLE